MSGEHIDLDAIEADVAFWRDTAQMGGTTLQHETATALVRVVRAELAVRSTAGHTGYQGARAELDAALAPFSKPEGS